MTSAPVRLLLGFHAHQPVGNFAHVIDDAVVRCYRPFLQTLERHPRVRFSLHVSGWLLGRLERDHPDVVSHIARMVARDQVEMIGGGDTEPVLAAIPDRDRRDQLRAMSARLTTLFGAAPRGAWLAERAWESTIVPALHDCGLRFVAVDDYHFRSVGSDEQLTGYFSTEESGRRLDLFPISESLRYLIPFAPVEDVIAELDRFSDGAAAIYFDDLEKFGVWPDTHEWVYTGGWLERFLEQIESSARFSTQPFGDFHRRNRSRGLIYLPTTSYAEMNEWTLPPSGARRLRELMARSRAGGTLAGDRPMLRGGTWKSFLLKYPEANWMHKRMQQASRRLHALPRPAQTPEMLRSLHRAQANDAYWHGLFGGLYLPFLRRSVYANLAELEEQLDALTPRPPAIASDIDLDGRREIALRGGRFFAVIRPAEGGGLCELTDYPLKHNFADVLARRDEEYYDAIRSGAAIKPVRGGIASIHERVVSTAHIHSSDLEPDRAPRGLFVDAWFAAGGPSGEIVRYRCEPLAEKQPAARCAAQLDGLTIEKVYRIERDTLLVRYELTAHRPLAGALAVQLDLAMPSCDGEGGAFVSGGGRLGNFGQPLALSDANALVLDDAVLGGRLELAAMPACHLQAAPLVTVSRSESGFEKIMQATTLSLSWVIALGAGERAERTIMLRAATARSSGRARADARASRDTDTSGSGMRSDHTTPDEDRA
jgi:4-alpha-glucanotransferase